MDVTPIAADSLSVRSMATLVETADIRILIDAGAALGPRRYGLPPTPDEERELAAVQAHLAELAPSCDVFVISHYHYDHYDPAAALYRGKLIYAKAIDANINKSQKQRGTEFAAAVDENAHIEYVDDRELVHGNTRIVFSPPFPHGPAGSPLGSVLATLVDDGTRLIHASDVQGPVVPDVADWIIEQKPDLLIMDGPPTLFLGWKFSQANLNAAIDNLLRIIDACDCKIILDHHLLRDLAYRTHLAAVFDTGRVQTAAEYLGREITMLEAHRKEYSGAQTAKRKRAAHA